MYYRTSRRRSYITNSIDKWLKDGKISPEMGRGISSSELRNGDDLIRGFNNYTQFSQENNAEAPIPDGLGGYVPNGGTPFPPSEERSRLTPMNYDGIYERDIRLMHNLYGDINSFLYPIVVSELNNMEFSGSSVYDYSLAERQSMANGSIRDEELDRESLSQIVNSIYDKAVMADDGTNEIMLDDNSALAGRSREDLLKAAIESLVLTELFLSRRPFYRDTSDAYRYFNGRYDGINPTM